MVGGSSASARVWNAGWLPRSDYAGTKSALEGYSRGAARDLAHRGITVDVVRSGFIDTEMNPADSPAAAVFLPTTAMGRYGRPEEIAAGVVFLAGPQAPYVTGAVLRSDGGYGAWRARTGQPAGPQQRVPAPPETGCVRDRRALGGLR